MRLLLRRARETRPGRPRASPAPPWPRSARARPPSCERTASRRRRAGALRGRGAGRGARAVEVGGPARARGPRRRGARACCPTRLRERGAEVDVVALYDTVAEPLGDAERAALGRATYVTFTSSSTVRFLLESGGGRPTGARVVSIGPVTSATAREHGLSRARRGRAPRHRRPRGRPDCRRRGAQGARVIVTLLTDYGRDDDFVGVCHGVIRADPPGRRDRRHHPRHPALRRAPGRARAAQHAALHAGRRARGGGGPAGGHRAPRGRAAQRRRAHPRGPGQRAAEPRVGALRGRRPGGGRHALAAPARARVGHLPRPRHVRAGGAPGSPRGAELADAGDPLDPDDARSASSCRSRARRTARWSRTRW